MTFLFPSLFFDFYRCLFAIYLLQFDKIHNGASQSPLCSPINVWSVLQFEHVLVWIKCCFFSSLHYIGSKSHHTHMANSWCSRYCCIVWLQQRRLLFVYFFSIEEASFYCILLHWFAFLLHCMISFFFLKKIEFALNCVLRATVVNPFSI